MRVPFAVRHWDLDLTTYQYGFMSISYPQSRWISRHRPPVMTLYPFGSGRDFFNLVLFCLIESLAEGELAYLCGRKDLV